MSDTTVFVGGSRHLSRLNTDVKGRLDNVVENGFDVLVGDANGADKAVQKYLFERRYPNVTVFCMAGGCRNNIGSWRTRDITAPTGAKGFAFYSMKDRAMAESATHGLMLWDGESKGTLHNIITLVQRQKPIVVYFGPERLFFNVRTPADVTNLLGKCERNTLHRFERELDIAHAFDSRRLLT